MDHDDRDILNLLQDELDFIEKGGYGRSVRTPWKPTSAFQDSLTCINYADPSHAYPCESCHLVDFVSPELRETSIPCHHIALNRAGDTVEDLEARDNQSKTEEALKNWLREQIKRIQAQRSGQST